MHNLASSPLEKLWTHAIIKLILFLKTIRLMKPYVAIKSIIRPILRLSLYSVYTNTKPFQLKLFHII